MNSTYEPFKNTEKEKIFKKQLSSAQKFLKSKNRLIVADLKSSINHAIPYWLEIYKTYQPANSEEFQAAILDDFDKASQLVFACNYAINYYCELLSCRYFRKNPDKYAEYLSKVTADGYDIKNADETTLDGLLQEYALSIHLNFPDELKEISNFLYSDPIIESLLNKPAINPEECILEISKYSKKAYLTRKDIQEKIKLYTKIIFYGEKEYLPEDEYILTENISKNLKYSIQKIIEQIQKMGTYCRYVQGQQEQFESFGLPNFVSKNINIDNLPNILSNYSVDDLFALNTFWINRYNKDLISYAKASFAIIDLGLLDKIMSVKLPENFTGFDNLIYVQSKADIDRNADIIEKLDKSMYSQITNKIPVKDLESVLLKYSLLYYPTSRFIDKRQEQIHAGNTKNIKGFSQNDNEDFVRFSYDPLANQTYRLYGPLYEEYFQNLLPNIESNLKKDILLFAPLYCPEHLSYTQKVSALQALSTTFERLPNAGIVIEKDKKGEYRTQNKVLISLDTPFCSPISEHIHFKNLKDFYINYTGQSKIAIYEGDEDFKDSSGKHITSKIVLPLMDKQVDQLKQACSKKSYTPEAKDTVEHLYFLVNNSRIPDSLANKSNPKKKTRTPRRYLDLLDGKIYVKDDNNQFVLSDEQDSSDKITQLINDSNKKGSSYGDR